MKRKPLKRLSPDEQQALMHKLSGTTQQASADKVVQTTEPAPPTETKARSKRK
jgi:hypothetical protein